MSHKPSGEIKLKYSMLIEWSDDDEAFVVTVPELPGCRTHGATYEDAVRQAQDAIEGWLEAARLDGQTPPTPHTFAYWPHVSGEVEADATEDTPVESRSA